MQLDRKIGNLWVFQVATDLVAIIAAYYTTLFIRFHSVWGEWLYHTLNTSLGIRDTGELGSVLQQFYIDGGPRIILFLAATLGLLYALLDAYPGRRFLRKRPVGWSIIEANVTALILFYIYFYLRRNIFHPRSLFATLMFVNTFYAIVLRGLLGKALTAARTRLDFDRLDAVLLGESEDADYIKSLIDVLHPHGMHLAARLPVTGLTDDAMAAEVESVAREKQADMLITGDKDLSVTRIMLVLDVGARLGIPVYVLSDKLDVLRNQAGMAVEMIKGTPLVFYAAPTHKRLLDFGTRLVSVAVALLVLVVTLPLSLLVALLIKLGDGGPVFFVQERMGVNRKPFRMVKFRTMRQRADEEQAEVEALNESGEGLFKIRKDPRITPVGRALRRFSIDELPQLLNVVKGDMLLVGPRPLPKRDFENYYEDWHYSRHSGVPGLTCLWQVSGRSDIDFHNMCILDVYYLRNRSWALDIRIVLRTIWVVLFARGAY